jgi:hypothetical protein
LETLKAVLPKKGTVTDSPACFVLECHGVRKQLSKALAQGFS